MERLKTPGVYIKEVDAFPNSVVQVPTAVPVFIGYTEKAHNSNSLVQVDSMNSFETWFGNGPTPAFDIAPAPVANAMVSIQGKFYNIENKAQQYYLYNSMRLFYANGGGPCYVISIGSYSDAVSLEAFTNALTILKGTNQGTMLVYPDALLLSEPDYYTWVNATLDHCRNTQNKVSLMDVYNGNATIDYTGPGSANMGIDNLRNQTGAVGLSYGAAYFPWVNASVVRTGEVSLLNFNIDQLTDALSAIPSPELSTALAGAATAAKKYASASTPQERQQALQAVTTANNALLSASRDYAQLLTTALAWCNTLPVTPAIAGIYSMVDNNRGVFKAPANIALENVLSPCSRVNEISQGYMLTDAASGKSINAIRAFVGNGVLVWGARTLDGNSQDWRYVNVRRTMIMLEQSIKAAAQAYVFEPNVATTWSSVSAMINTFLTDQWKQGALVGATPAAAFSVAVGLGTTMTSEDILNGIMRISVEVAITHPAEFIVITFEQQMAQS